MWQLTLEEAKRRFPEVVEAVLRGDTVQITTEQGTIQMTAVSPPRRRCFGSARGLVTIHDDFDVPIEDFAGYI